jgi:hypothetical protein
MLDREDPVDKPLPPPVAPTPSVSDTKLPDGRNNIFTHD